MNIKSKSGTVDQVKSRKCWTMGLFLAVFFISMPLFAQTSVTITVKNQPIRQVLKLIESKSSYRFFFNNQMPDLKKTVSLDVKSASIDATMTKLLEGTQLIYSKRENYQVYLAEREKTAPVQSKGTTISGQVIDENGEPVIGANVSIKGTTIGVITDIDGNFRIQAPKGATISVSFIGYTSREVTVGNRTNLNITLNEDALALDEVVVVGYGTQKKIHVTGSVAQITSKDLVKTPAPNVSQLLTGKLPGLVSRQAGGQPGSDGVTMLVRGYGSFNGSSPLILVDGVERPINNLDPNDIESVSVLKDAAASAVYGMKAAHGVILVTTKRGGTDKKPSISYSGSLNLSQNTTLPEFCDGPQYAYYYNKARELDGLNTPENPYFTPEEIAMMTNGDPTDGYENTDWKKIFMGKLTPMQQHNVSVTGGNESIRFFTSGGFMEQRGFISSNKFTRANIRSNVDAKVTNDISATVNLSARVEDSYTPGAYTYANQAFNNPITVAMFSLPFVPETYNGYPASGYRGASNPIASSENTGFQKSNNLVFESSASLEYRFPMVKGLKAKAFISYDRKHSESKSFAYSYKLMNYNLGQKKYILQDCGGMTPEANLYNGNSRDDKLLIRPSIEYANTFEKHDVGAMFLYEQTTNSGGTLSGSRYGYPIISLPELDLGNTIPKNPNTGRSTKSAYAGFVGRLNYTYSSKYLAEFAFRYDGSYKFAKDHRWGFFPSASLGWVVSEEDFFKSAATPIDRLKVRASAGLLGHDNVNEFLFGKYYSMSSAPNVAFGSALKEYYTIFSSNSYPAKDLTWEKTRTINGGFELTAWNGLLSVEFDAFYKYTYDILQSISGAYPPSLGGNFPSITNSGRFDAKGFELQLGHKNNAGDIYYRINGNVAYTKNRILSRTQNDNVLDWQSVLGRPVGGRLGYVSEGFYQTEEELLNAPIPPSGGVSALRLGDIKYKDKNGDGKIDSNDMEYIAHSSMPELTFSLSGDMSYKNFDLSIMFQGVALCDNLLSGVYANNATDNTPFTKPFYGNSDNPPLYLVENSWTPENPGAKYPRLSTRGNSNNAVTSTTWMVDGAYLRLKNLAIGYTLPKAWLKKARIENLRIYVAGTNLFTLTEFGYLDPEAPSVITGYYPQQRTYSFGVNLGF